MPDYAHLHDIHALVCGTFSEFTAIIYHSHMLLTDEADIYMCHTHKYTHIYIYTRSAIFIYLLQYLNHIYIYTYRYSICTICSSVYIYTHIYIYVEHIGTLHHWSFFHNKPLLRLFLKKAKRQRFSATKSTVSFSWKFQVFSLGQL